MLARILIADDSAIMRRTLKALLESRPDWQVCGEASTGQEAMQQAVELKPDMIVLDFAMPPVDGLEAAREILVALPRVPILLYTDYVFSPEAKVQAGKCGVRDVVNKGTSPEQVLKAIETLLRQGARPVTDAAQAVSALADKPETDPQPS